MDLSVATGKIPATPGIELGTFWLVAQCLNHYAVCVCVKLAILTSHEKNSWSINSYKNVTHSVHMSYQETMSGLHSDLRKKKRMYFMKIHMYWMNIFTHHKLLFLHSTLYSIVTCWMQRVQRLSHIFCLCPCWQVLRPQLGTTPWQLTQHQQHTMFLQHPV